MTDQLKNELLNWALEDCDLAKEKGSMSVTDTQVGVITINCTNDVYQAWNNQGEQLTGEVTKEFMMNWLVGKYQVVESETGGI